MSERETSEAINEQAMRWVARLDRDGLALIMPTAELELRMTDFPPELRDVDSARFDAGVLPPGHAADDRRVGHREPPGVRTSADSPGSRQLSSVSGWTVPQPP